MYIIYCLYSDLFYVRNHLPVPAVDPSSYELEVEIEGTRKSFAFTLDQLKKFEKHTINATIMCAGNRRSEMSAVGASLCEKILQVLYEFDYCAE